MNLKGTLPTLVLQVLEHGPLHGYAIAQEIKQRSRGTLDFREGTLYPALHNQEKKGRVRSFEQVENGRRRRCYELTAEGIRVLAEEKEQWRSLAGAVGMVLETS